MEEQSFPHPENTLRSWEISQGQGASVAQRRVQQEEERKTSADSPGYRVALPSPR